MKTFIFFFVLIITVKAQTTPVGQTVYEVLPGMKGNQIKLTVANISETDAAQDVEIKKLLHPYKGEHQNVIFAKESQVIEKLNSGEEKEVIFEFDISRNAPVNNKDTVDFIVSYNNSTATLKSFIFNYLPPKDYKLEQNFPNPFNPMTTIQYQLPSDSKVTLKIYDILGGEAATLINEFQDAGYKEIRFDASSLASGIYIYRLTAQNFITTKKMMVLK